MKRSFKEFYMKTKILFELQRILSVHETHNLLNNRFLQIRCKIFCVQNSQMPTHREKQVSVFWRTSNFVEKLRLNIAFLSVAINMERWKDKLIYFLYLLNVLKSKSCNQLYYNCLKSGTQHFLSHKIFSAKYFSHAM